MDIYLHGTCINRDCIILLGTILFTGCSRFNTNNSVHVPGVEGTVGSEGNNSMCDDGYWSFPNDVSKSIRQWVFFERRDRYGFRVCISNFQENIKTG